MCDCTHWRPRLPCYKKLHSGHLQSHVSSSSCMLARFSVAATSWASCAPWIVPCTLLPQVLLSAAIVLHVFTSSPMSCMSSLSTYISPWFFGFTMGSLPNFECGERDFVRDSSVEHSTKVTSPILWRIVQLTLVKNIATQFAGQSRITGCQQK
jgi:hypothetical protein